MSAPAPQQNPISPVLGTLQAKQLGVAWVVAVLAGVAIISVSDTTSSRHLIWPVIVLVIYAVYALNRWTTFFGDATEAFKQSIASQIADSIYFMGFVWTLWALIDSFVLRAKLDTPDAMFRAFGYALVTTAVGMFGRLAILQFKYTAIDQSQEAQESVEQLLRQFADTLRQGDEALINWRTRLENGAESISECSAELQKVLTGIRTETDESVRFAIGSLREGVRNATQHIDSVINALGDQLTQSIKEGVTEGMSALGKETSRSLDEIREATRALTTALKEGCTSISNASTTAASGFDHMGASLKATTEQLGLAAAALNGAMAAAGVRAEKAADQFASDIALIPNAVRSDCKEASSLLVQASTDVKKEISEKLGSIDASALTADRISQGLVHAVGPATEILGAIDVTVKGIHDVVGSQDGQRTSLLSEIRDRLPSRIEAGITRIQSRLDSIGGQIGTTAKQKQNIGWRWPWTRE